MGLCSSFILVVSRTSTFAHRHGRGLFIQGSSSHGLCLDLAACWVLSGCNIGFCIVSSLVVAIVVWDVDIILVGSFVFTIGSIRLGLLEFLFKKCYARSNEGL